MNHDHRDPNQVKVTGVDRRAGTAHVRLAFDHPVAGFGLGALRALLPDTPSRRCTPRKSAFHSGTGEPGESVGMSVADGRRLRDGLGGHGRRQTSKTASGDRDGRRLVDVKDGRDTDGSTRPSSRGTSLRSPLTIGTSNMRIGILTGGGDVPGLNACIKAVVGPGNRGRERGHRHPAWLGWSRRGQRRHADGMDVSFVPLTTSSVRTIDRYGGTTLHTSRTNPGQDRPRGHPRRAPPHGSAATAPGTGPPTSRLSPRGARAAEDRRPRPDRRRRHALVRAEDARRGSAGGGHPQDDGQRRPRDRLLHRLLNCGHPRRRVRPRPCAPPPARTSGSRWSSCSRYSGETSLITAYLAGVDRCVISEVPVNVDRLAELLCRGQASQRLALRHGDDLRGARLGVATWSRAVRRMPMAIRSWEGWDGPSPGCSGS